MGQGAFEKIGSFDLLVALALAPWFFYPLFLVKILCYAMFACDFNLMLGA